MKNKAKKVIGEGSTIEHFNATLLLVKCGGTMEHAKTQKKVGLVITGKSQLL